MYYLLSILSGIVIAVMIAVNGELAALQGVYLSTAAIHVVGLVFVAVLMAVRKTRPLPDRGTPPYLYLGGVIGVATVVFNSLGFGGISLSALTGLGLLGQSVTSLAVDRFGWFHMPKRSLDRRKWRGIGVVLAGILCMLAPYTPDAVLPVAVSLLAGVSIVISRTVNAGLAGRSGVLKSTFYNYVTGLTVSLLVLAVAGPIGSPALSPPPWMYLGGLLGVAAVLLSNIIVEKISSFYMTLLLFVGQVFAGVGVDTLLSGSFSPENLAGGLLVAAGLLYNLWLDRPAARSRPAAAAPPPPPPAVPRPPLPDVELPTRPAVALICPHCWTGQRAQRSRCYHCGARFVYRDEIPVHQK